MCGHGVTRGDGERLSTRLSYIITILDPDPDLGPCEGSNVPSHPQAALPPASGTPPGGLDPLKEVILLAACGANEVLPQVCVSLL